MSFKIKKIIENISYSVGANVLNTLISVLLVFIVPKVLGVREYAYWQLYSFYISYIGFFHLGWLDGIYLRFGGEKYENLDKPYFHTQFWLLIGMELLFTVIICGMSLLFIADSDKQFVLCLTSMCCVLQIPRTFLQYLLQITNRVSDYAKNFILEKVVYAVLVLGLLLVGVTNYKVLLVSDLIARTLTLLLLVKQCKDIVFSKGVDLLSGIKEARYNIHIGIKLLSANIASMLLTGIVRIVIEDVWNIETFGKVSLSLTVCNMMMVLINAISVVIYPMLKTTKEEKLAEVYSTIRMLLMIPMLGMLIIYYPAKVILSQWLPQYAESLRYMALVFPMCIFEGKFALLVCTYLKALRKEKDIMRINVCAVIITAILSYFTAYFLKDLMLTILLLPFLLGFRSAVAEFIVARNLHISIGKELLWELFLCALFIVVSWKYQSVLCTVLYAIVYLLYLYINKEKLRVLFELTKQLLKKEREC